MISCKSFECHLTTQVGAVVQEDISEASVVFGVKQVPVDSLQSNKTFCFFSHTIKAQQDNMELLDACLEKNVRLVDYEVHWRYTLISFRARKNG